MKFTTLIPTTRNDGTDVEPSVLSRVIDRLWHPFGGMTDEGRVTAGQLRLRYGAGEPFGGMTDEGRVTGHWIDSGTEYTDVCIKVSIECDRGRLQEAIQAVRRVGRKLDQKAMYCEVTGYDGVQILRIDSPGPKRH